jgi:hypothetical protein
MILASVTHHIESNTLEAVWLETINGSNGQPDRFERAKCTSYSAEQRAEFIADTGKPEYADLAGWAE